MPGLHSQPRSSPFPRTQDHAVPIPTTWALGCVAHSSTIVPLISQETEILCRNEVSARRVGHTLVCNQKDCLNPTSAMAEPVNMTLIFLQQPYHVIRAQTKWFAQAAGSGNILCLDVLTCVIIHVPMVCM